MPRHIRAVVVGAHKLIAAGDGRIEAYDLRVDPRETNPDGVTPDERAALGRTLDAMQARAARNAAPPQTPVLDEQTAARMRALGY